MAHAVRKRVTSVVIVLVLCLLATCTGENTRARAASLLATEPAGYRDEDPSSRSVRELEKQVKKYEKAVARKVRDTSDLGVYYRLLAVEYLARDMFGPSLEALEQAIHIMPENPVLHHLRGAAAGRYAKSLTDATERARYFAEAETSYLRALALDSSYADALYGISVLYVFELAQPSRAEPYLSRLLARQDRHYEAMFLLARIYAESGRGEEAIGLYDSIIDSRAPEAYRSQAREIRRVVSGGFYGS